MTTETGDLHTPNPVYRPKGGPKIITRGPSIPVKAGGMTPIYRPSGGKGKK